MMDQKRWKKIEAILDKALALKDQQEVKTMITNACKKDPKLYQQVTQLMHFIREAQNSHFLEP